MTAAAARRKILGVIAEFPSATALYQAAEQVRDKGYRFWDVHSPFPIHGMNKAMGLGKSPLGYIIFCGGLTGDSLLRLRSSLSLLLFSIRSLFMGNR